MVFIPIRLRNQIWDKYHFSGTQDGFGERSLYRFIRLFKRMETKNPGGNGRTQTQSQRLTQHSSLTQNKYLQYGRPLNCTRRPS